MRAEQRRHACARGEALAHVLGPRRLAPRVPQLDDLCAVPARHQAPALAEVARRYHENAIAGRDEVRDGGLHRAAAGRGEQDRVAPRAEDLRQPCEHPLEHGPELGAAVIDEGLGHRRLHLRRNRRRTGRHQITGLGHSSEGSGPPRRRSVQGDQDGDEGSRDGGARGGERRRMPLGRQRSKRTADGVATPLYGTPGTA